VSTSPERYFVEHLLPAADEILAMEQRLGRVDVHWHDFYELAYVVDGAARHVVNGTAETIRPGSCLMLTPADFHSFEPLSDEPLVCFNVVIDTAVVERDLGDLVAAATGWAPATLHGCERLEPDFRRLLAESEHGGMATGALREAALRCILIELGRAVGRAPDGQQAAGADAGTDAELRRAIVHVDRHFREQLTLAEVAAQAHLSPNYFSERFAEAVGSTFQTYLQHKRLRFARALLTSTTLPVTEVCHAAGFNSPSHFGRAYRKRYGHPPSDHRPTLAAT
jgi:AraC-like DNA-binding protein/mannose-6-phosphate isomerase-like protein (cupin superfamily)